MKKTIITLLVITLAVGALFIASSSALAYRGDPNVKGPNYSPERHTAVTEALKNNDYNTWKELMQGNGKVTQVVNEGNFNRFVEMHNLMLEGKNQEADVIRQELGIGLRDGSRQGQRSGYGRNANR